MDALGSIIAWLFLAGWPWLFGLLVAFMLQPDDRRSTASSIVMIIAIVFLPLWLESLSLLWHGDRTDRDSAYLLAGYAVVIIVLTAFLFICQRIQEARR